MKLTLDYENKVVSLDDETNVNELVNAFKLAVSDWTEWKIETKITIQSNPYPYPYQFPAYPTYPIITY